MEEWALLLNSRIIKRFTINEGESLTIGRGQDANVIVDNNAISRQHSTLELKGGVYYLTDHYSLNGTKVNGEKIDSAVPIKKTDQIGIGKFTLKPTEFLTNEEEAESSSSSIDNMDQTIFVNSKTKKPPAAEQDTLKVVDGSATPQALPLTSIDSVKVGKGSSCDVVIGGLFVAKTQFFISKNGDGYRLTPCQGWRKVFLNGDKIREEVRIRKGDVIRVAGTSFRLD